MYPACRRGPWRGKIPEADGGGRAAPDPGLRRWRGRVGAGFEPEGGHLVFLVDDAQCEVMQGAAKDSVGAVIQQRRYVSDLPYKHRRSAGEVGGQLRQRPAAVLCLMAECSAALSVLENCSRKVLGGISGESKNWPGKMSGEPNTSRRTQGRWSTQFAAAQRARRASLRRRWKRSTIQLDCVW